MFPSGVVFSGPGSLEHHECPPSEEDGVQMVENLGKLHI